MTLFEEIYSAAVDQRLEQLSNFSSIDVQNYSGLTPAGKLASEGNLNIAMILHRKFSSNVNYIALGAALGGHIEFAMELFNKHRADVRYIARGAARGGHTEFAMKLFNEHGADVNEIACGAASGGHTEFAMELLNKHDANVNYIAQGAAFGGHIGFAMKLLNKHAAGVNYIALGAALGGHIAFAMELLNEHGADVNDIALGAALGGHIGFSMKLLNEHGADLKYIARGAAQSGHIAFAMELLKEHGADVNDIALGAVQGGHIGFAMELLKEHGADVRYIAQGAIFGGYFEFAMGLLKEHGADVNDIAQGAAFGGHFEFAMELLNKHGANVNYIALGAAVRGYFEFAMELLKEHGADVNDIAHGAAQGGHIAFAMELLNKHGANVNDIALGAVQGGHIKFAMELLNKHGANVNDIAQAVNEYFYNASSTMQHILPIENAEDRKKIIAMFENEPSFNPVVKEALPRIAQKIDNIYHFKRTYGVGMQQAQFLQMCPEIRSFMIQCYAPLINNGRCTKMSYALPKEIFLLITLFLAPAYMSFEGVEELLFKLQQQTLINALKSYIRPAGWFSQWFTRKPVHEERAQSVQEAIRKTKNLGEMAALVCKQHSLFSRIDKYNSAGQTPLIIATSNGDITEVEDLLKAGANPDKPELKNKRTPLSIAVLANCENLVKCLLQYHARIDLKDSDGNTPYHLARNNGSNAEIMHLLSSEPVAPVPSKHEKPLENDTQDAYYSLLHRSIMRLD
ncbi:ankyrin repeat domain-containing protein [Legionella fallonii]|uniref:Uncharacterized protein n=1 Tax=Legionella fallonii LLAP-10 TaxID=1212491 RepID=A0A098G5L9_9GAMM|nr:ankyrin repeat domain-containing protein [Legionella fallonii]CEG57274.1 protein of unknown function [ankyrin domain] [Legionella fallonii LLAP-10]